MSVLKPPIWNPFHWDKPHCQNKRAARMQLWNSSAQDKSSEVRRWTPARHRDASNRLCDGTESNKRWNLSKLLLSVLPQYVFYGCIHTKATESTDRRDGGGHRQLPGKHLNPWPTLWRQEKNKKESCTHPFSVQFYMPFLQPWHSFARFAAESTLKKTSKNMHLRFWWLSFILFSCLRLHFLSTYAFSSGICFMSHRERAYVPTFHRFFFKIRPYVPTFPFSYICIRFYPPFSQFGRQLRP